MLHSKSSLLKRLLRGFSSSPKTQEAASCKPFDAIPGPRALPVIGNIWRYLPLIGDYKLDQLFENARLNRRLYGPIVRELITPKHTVLHLFDPADIETLFRLDGSCPYRRSHRALLKYRLDRPHQYTNGGLFPENGPHWERQRKQFHARLMSKQQVSLDASKIHRCVHETVIEELSKQLNGRDRIRVQSFDRLLTRWAFASSLAVFLDTSLSELEPAEISSTMDQLHNSLVAIDGTELHSDRWVESAEKCEHYAKLVRSQDHLYEFVSKRIHRLSSGSTCDKTRENHSFVMQWIREDRIERKDLVSFIIDALMAGYHTTTYTAAHLMYHLSSGDPSIVARLRLDPSDDLLDRCLKEAMRLNPVAIGTGRVIQRDDAIIGGYLIPKGTMVIAHTQTASRDASIFEEPDRFDPDRWISHRQLAKSDRRRFLAAFANLPFGFGPRACIGQRVATMQIKTLASSLVNEFDIQFATPISTRTTLIHNIAKPVEILVLRAKRSINHDI